MKDAIPKNVIQVSDKGAISRLISIIDKRSHWWCESQGRLREMHLICSKPDGALSDDPDANPEAIPDAATMQCLKFVKAVWSKVLLILLLPLCTISLRVEESSEYHPRVSEAYWVLVPAGAGLLLATTLPALHFSKASLQSCPPNGSNPPHLSPTILQVLSLIISSTLLSLRTIFANISVRGSLGNHCPLYGSSLSSTTLSLWASVSASRVRVSGSSGSLEVATDAQ